MRNPIIIIIFRSLDRLLGKNLYNLEERLANSAPMRQFARTAIALFQRGVWQIKQLKLPPPVKGDNLSDIQQEITQQFRLYQSALKKKLEDKK